MTFRSRRSSTSLRRALGVAASTARRRASGSAARSVQAAEDPPHVGREPVADLPGDPVQAVDRRGQAARRGRSSKMTENSSASGAASRAVGPVAEEPGLGLGLVGQGPEQRGELGDLDQARLLGQPDEDPAEQADDALDRARRSGRASTGRRRPGSGRSPPPRLSSTGWTVAGSRLNVLTGPSERTQVSLLPPPFCIETTSVSADAAIRVRPPGMTA